ncbi:hypothetical protein DY000_02044516 [Brassica cretica]|uniref:Uncharacterized protein n=1 Tax=Brassica cretica TaxID=69181 RepID=A0ABQ7FBY9_BRACR|nr:hypothetical protein DY000_02044516 [Brassica cretica]
MNSTPRRCSRKTTHACSPRLDSLYSRENPEAPHKEEESKMRGLRERLENRRAGVATGAGEIPVTGIKSKAAVILGF